MYKAFTRFIIVAAILIAFYVVIAIFLPIGAFAESNEYCLYVNTRVLNGREFPSTNASREAFFEKGETVSAIELNDNGWVLVEGGETGVVWCKAEYLSESETVRKWKNVSGGSVNLRKNPSCEAKRVGRIKAGRVMRITAEVFGWGYIKDQGWVDLSYFEVVDDGE